MPDANIQQIVSDAPGTATLIIADPNGSGDYAYTIYRSTATPFNLDGSTQISGILQEGPGFNYVDNGPLTAGTTYYYVVFIHDNVYDDGQSSGYASYTVPVPSVDVSAALVSRSQTKANLAGSASGGTGPYTYQWYRALTTGFSPGSGNAVSGATATTLADTGLAPATAYFYVLRATDSDDTAGDSAQVAATTTAFPTGLYIGYEQVRVRLVGKVRFTESTGDEEGRMSMALCERLINEAEGQVEHDLSPRYAMPFVTDADASFTNLPARPTKEILSTLCELQACIRILETDFGTGSATDGEKYSKNLIKRYDEILKRLLAKKLDGNVASQGWMYPPLPGLKLNYMNLEADDGYAGQVLVASGSPSQGAAAGQINDPSATFWNGGWPSGC